MTIRAIAITVFLIIAVFGATNTTYGQPAKADLTHLRKSFKLAMEKEFQITTDRIVEYKDKWRGGPFMLFHVKPKQSGIYKLKYTYRMKDDFYYEGENEVVIRVGDRKCDRDLRAEEWKTMFCLGDTVIIPVRLKDSSNHVFSLESIYQKTVARTGSQSPYFGVLNKKIVANPLAANLEYIGFHRSEQMSRSATGGGSISHEAFFKAKSAGRFNLSLSVTPGERSDNPDITKPFLNAVPVIIVNPGTPVTALVPHEKITGYTKGRAYSSDNTVSYQTNLLILQPGDFISEAYSIYIISPGGSGTIKYSELKKDPVPVIQKLPFLLKKDGSYNDWIAGYLP
jgi:hypothetical protein